MNNNTPNFIPAQPPQYNPVHTGRQTKSKFLTFIFSLIPGAGQMYQGLMKRGLSIMLLFTGILAASIFTYISALIIILPAIWFYSFFDTINRIKLTKEELAGLKDEFLFINLVKNEDSEKAFRQVLGQRHLLLGWGIIVFSVWLILKIMFKYHFIYSNIPQIVYSFFAFIIDFFPSMIIPAACIYIGVRLIKGSGSHKHQKPKGAPENSQPGGVE